VFSPAPTDAGMGSYATQVIKKRIEDLIAREYLERDVDQPNLFRYLA
jgi:hypothetical protein